MANIQLLQGTEKIKDSYTKINTSVTNLNNAKVEKSGDTMTGFLTFANFRGLLCDGGNDTGANLDYDFPNVTTGSANLRAFRNTNTTGNKNFILLAGDGSANPAFWVQNGRIIWISGQNVMITAHAGNPNGNVTAPPGSICLNTSGGAGTSLYVKESGTGNTGWVAK